MSNLLCLPDEMLRLILANLATSDDLASISLTARVFHTLAREDELWRLALERETHRNLSSPDATSTFRMMYQRHKPHWFLTRQAFWHSDETPGRLMYSRYNDKTDNICLLYTSPSPRDGLLSRMPSSA